MDLAVATVKKHSTPTFETPFQKPMPGIPPATGVKSVFMLKAAGLEVKPEEVSEKTGYSLSPSSDM